MKMASRSLFQLPSWCLPDFSSSDSITLIRQIGACSFFPFSPMSISSFLMNLPFWKLLAAISQDQEMAVDRMVFPPPTHSWRLVLEFLVSIWCNIRSMVQNPHMGFGGVGCVLGWGGLFKLHFWASNGNVYSTLLFATAHAMKQWCRSSRGIQKCLVLSSQVMLTSYLSMSNKDVYCKEIL